MMLLQIFVSHLIWKPPPAWLAHSSPDELLLGKSEGPPRKNRGHNQEQTFSRGRSDVFETSQFIPNCGQPPLLDVVCVPTQHSKHFWFWRASNSHHSQTFCHHFFLSFESRFPPISILPLCCSWQCSADRWFSLLQTNYLAPEQRGWLVTQKKTPTKTLNLNIGG